MPWEELSELVKAKKKPLVSSQRLELNLMPWTTTPSSASTDRMNFRLSAALYVNLPCPESWAFIKKDADLGCTGAPQYLHSF